jgi:dienelactone hydrolase
MLARHHGISAVAIDAPGHGERAEAPMSQEVFTSIWARPNIDDETVADWRGTLDAVVAELDPGPIGYWGLSQGTMMGVPLVAAEPRIEVALLGLMGIRDLNAARLRADAPNVRCPVRFLVQWDDELIERDRAFALFDALGADPKELRAHPGLHSAVPPHEFRDSVTFLARHLLRDGDIH